jgi:hypothetical protein
MTTTGGCQCGAVRYRAEPDPGFSIICCCRQCQRITGAGHAAQFALPAAAVRISGALTRFKLVADSGNMVESAFCGTCGSPVLKTSSGFPDLIFFHAATLDDPAVYRPSAVVWHASQQPWDHFDPSLARQG